MLTMKKMTFPLVGIIFLSAVAAAWAASTKLSSLSSGGAIAGTDLFYDVQTAGTGGVQVTATQVATYIMSLLSGSCTASSGGVLACPIVAGTTVTSGVTSGDLLSSTSNRAADSGIAVSNIPLLNGSNTFTGVLNTIGNTRITGSLTLNEAVVDSGYGYQVVTTGFTFTPSNQKWHSILDPAGTLATGTITMPAAADGQVISVRTSQTITALTVNPDAGHSILGNPTTLVAGGGFNCMFRNSNTTWYCSNGS